MRLEYDPNVNQNSLTKYPQGYWYACTDDGGYDADGATPLDAVTKLAMNLEDELKGK